MNETKPLAFIDIDGVLNRFGFASPMDAMHYVAHEVEATNGGIFLLHVDEADAQRLARLSEHFELAWGTTWEHDAPMVSHLIGVDSRDWIVATRTREDGELFKSPGIVRAAAGRPFVWFDDDLWDTDSEVLAASGVDNLAILIEDPSVGLRDEHVETAIEWAKARRTE